MWDLTIEYNGNTYNATYNEQSGYYEVEIPTSQSGVSNAEITFTDIWNDEYTRTQPIQVWKKEEVHIDINKVFMWIFDYTSGTSLETKDIVEISDYEIKIDEETNAKSVVNVLKKTNAKAKDIVAIKKNNEVIYWGIIEEIQNENGTNLWQYSLRYITNLFDRKIQLKNESLISQKGIEDFIENAIKGNFTNSLDTFINLNYITLIINSHNKKQVTVTNVENGIYNLHTWMTNCTQNYDITYKFEIVNKKLKITIEKEQLNTELIDTYAQSISNYTEVFETKIISKVVVLYSKVGGNDSPGTYTLYLKNDRTTTTNASDPQRASGDITTIYTENYEDAPQEALNVIKANSYNHNITFDLLDKYIKIGTPIAIKTKQSIIYNTYISSITIKPNKFVEYVCGNIRINFIDKLLKERK